MIDWTTVLSSAVPVLILVIAGLALILVLRPHLRSITTKYGSVRMGDEPGVTPSYMIELLWEVVQILEGRTVLRGRLRDTIKRYVRQWRSNVALYVAEELRDQGATTDGLHHNPIYRYLMATVEALSHDLVRLIMVHAERNGFELLDQEAERSAYVAQRVAEVEQYIRDQITQRFVVSANAAITHQKLMSWLDTRKPLTEAIWSELYRQMITISLDTKSQLIMEADRILAKGQVDQGLRVAEADQIRNFLRRKLEEQW